MQTQHGFISAAVLSAIILGFAALAVSPAFAQTDDYGTGTTSGTYCPQLFQTVVRGSSGNQVLELQEFLSDYYDIAPTTIQTGYFGHITQSYVIRFQQEQGLPSYGIAGPLTRAAITKVCGSVSIVPPQQIQPPLIINTSSFAATPASGPAPLDVNFSLSQYDTAGADYDVNFGDGSATRRMMSRCPTYPGAICTKNITVPHNYIAAGVYTANLVRTSCTLGSNGLCLTNIPTQTQNVGAVTITVTGGIVTMTPTITVASPATGASITQGLSLAISWQTQNAPDGTRVALWRLNTATGESALVQYDQPATGQYSAYVRRDGEPVPTCPVGGGGTGYWPTGCWNYMPWPAGSYKITAKLYTPNAGLMPASYIAISASGTFTVIANPYQQQSQLPTTCTSYNSTVYNEGQNEPPRTIVGDQFANSYPSALNFSTLACHSGWWVSSVDNTDYCSYLRYALGTNGQYANISFPNGVCSVTGSGTTNSSGTVTGQPSQQTTPTTPH